jgi:hypothetical protein
MRNIISNSKYYFLAGFAGFAEINLKYQRSPANIAWRRSEPEVGTRLKAVTIEGVIPVVCIFCRVITCIEFDLDLHLYECHRMDLVKLPIGSGSLNFRIEYAIEEGRRFGQALNLFDDETKQRLGFSVSK